MEKLTISEDLIQKLELVTTKLIKAFEQIASMQNLRGNQFFGELQNKVNTLELEFKQLFDKLQNQSLKEFYFWDYCPFKVYEAYYIKRKELFLNEFVDANELDFIQKEIEDLNNVGISAYKFEPNNTDINYIKNLDQLRFYIFEIKNFGRIIINKILSKATLQKVEYSHNRKIDFLINKQISFDNIKNEKSISPDEEQNYLDYSDNKTPERIVFMHELGILEYLNKMPPFNTSINKLAEVLSAFTGIKQTTLQSYINPIFSKDVAKKNSPLTNKNIKTVNEKLIKMGFIKNNNNKQH